MSEGLNLVLEGHSVCGLNSSPGGPQCLRDLTLVLEGHSV